VRSTQALGLSLAEIADMLQVRDADGPPYTYVTELLQTRIHASTVRITELTALREELSARLPLGAEPDPTRCHPDQVCYLIEDDPPATPADGPNS
jgi:DNA-binding transcriptional MerR regulator